MASEPTLGDNIERLSRILWRMFAGNRGLIAERNLLGSPWTEMRAAYGRSDPVEARYGKAAKACGATAAQVKAWADGELEPTVNQRLALLDFLAGELS